MASQVHDASVSQVCWAPQESQKRCGSLLPPTPAPDQMSPGSKAGGAPWRHRGVGLSCVSMGTRHLIPFPPAHYPGGRKTFVDSQAVSRTLKFHSLSVPRKSPEFALHRGRQF